MSDQLTAIRTIAAPADAVRQIWVSPSTLVPPVTEIEMDPRVGGAIRLSTGGPRESDLTGVFVTAEPGRLAYTWRWGGFAEETLVDVRFHDAGSRTVVEVVHRGFLDEASRAAHRAGWQHYFDGVIAHIDAG